MCVCIGISKVNEARVQEKVSEWCIVLYFIVCVLLLNQQSTTQNKQSQKIENRNSIKFNFNFSNRQEKKFEKKTRRLMQAQQAKTVVPRQDECCGGRCGVRVSQFPNREVIALFTNHSIRKSKCVLKICNLKLETLYSNLFCHINNVFAD